MLKKIIQVISTVQKKYHLQPLFESKFFRKFNKSWKGLEIKIKAWNEHDISDSVNKSADKLLQQEQMLNRSLSIHEVQTLLGKETQKLLALK